MWWFGSACDGFTLKLQTLEVLEFLSALWLPCKKTWRASALICLCISENAWWLRSCYKREFLINFNFSLRISFSKKYATSSDAKSTSNFLKSWLLSKHSGWKLWSSPFTPCIEAQLKALFVSLGHFLPDYPKQSASLLKSTWNHLSWITEHMNTRIIFCWIRDIDWFCP